MPTTEASVVPSGTGRRPREDEIDACGVTHPGKVRRDNQDHYLLCSLRREVVVRGSSIPQADAVLGNESERLASMAMVADGVGGAAKGETASRVALTGIARYVSRSLRCYYRSEEEEDFSEALRQGAPRESSPTCSWPCARAPGSATRSSDGWPKSSPTTAAWRRPSRSISACGPGPTCCRWATAAVICCATGS